MASELNEQSKPLASSDVEEAPPSDEVEISRDEALTSLLKNNELSDLSLRGSDGVCVTANRCWLASRSPVFHRMLFGKFKEASDTVINVHYDGAILQAIVDYIYTNEIPTMTIEAWGIRFAGFLVMVVDAANYFTLPELRRKIETSVNSEIRDKPGSTAPLFLAVCAPVYNTTRVLYDRAMEAVKVDPGILVNCSKEILAMIGRPTIEILLKDLDLPMDTYTRFQILQAWFTAGESNKDRVTNAEDSGSRKRSAEEMTIYLRLEEIDIEELSSTVSSSGFLTEKQIADACKTIALNFKVEASSYKTQALIYKTQASSSQKQAAAAKKKLVAFRKDVRAKHVKVVWGSSGTTIFEYNNRSNSVRDTTDTLFSSIMKRGVHKWTLRVLKYNPGMELGVASTSRLIQPDTYLSNQRGGWVLTEGSARHNFQGTRFGLPPFSAAGSKVSFTLNLDGEGILTASINGGATFELFTGMITAEDNGFVPAASFCPVSHSRVEFLGFV